MKKFGIYMLRFAWIIIVFVATMWTMYVTAVTLGTAIPDGTNVWVRLAIGVPCIFMAPLCVELILIIISRRIDRRTGWLGMR